MIIIRRFNLKSCNVVQVLKSMDKICKIKANELSFHVVLFIFHMEIALFYKNFHTWIILIVERLKYCSKTEDAQNEILY